MEQAKNKEDTESFKMKSLLRIIFINHSIRDGVSGKNLLYQLKYTDKTTIVPVLTHFYSSEPNLTTQGAIFC